MQWFLYTIKVAREVRMRDRNAERNYITETYAHVGRYFTIFI